MSVLDEFNAYYRLAHSVKTSAGRIVKGNAKKFLLEELNYIINAGKISKNFESEIKDFRTSRLTNADFADNSPELQRLKNLPEAQKKELIKFLAAQLTEL